MKRTSVCAAGLLIFSPFLIAQQEVGQPKPQLPASVLGPQLVVWSEMQRPHPISESRPADQSQTAPGQSQAQQLQQQNQVFTGTIVKDGGQYILRTTSNASYSIDDQEKANLYDGKRVKITGSLDAKTNVLHLVAVEPIL